MKDAKKSEESIPPSPGHEREWLDSIKSRKQPSCNVAYHNKLNAAIALGRLALELGRSIGFDPASERIVGDEEAANRPSGLERLQICELIEERETLRIVRERKGSTTRGDDT